MGTDPVLKTGVFPTPCQLNEPSLGVTAGCDGEEDLEFDNLMEEKIKIEAIAREASKQ